MQTTPAWNSSNPALFCKHISMGIQCVKFMNFLGRLYTFHGLQC